MCCVIAKSFAYPLRTRLLRTYCMDSTACYTQFEILVHVHSNISVCYARQRIYRCVKVHTYVLRIYNTVLVFHTVLKGNKKHTKTLNYSG